MPILDIDPKALPRATRAHTWWLWRQEGDKERATRHLSPILLRILAVNAMALAFLVGSLLYLGRYQDRIIDNELNSLRLQARIMASAVAEDAVVIDENDNNILSPLLARLMVRRLAETTETRTRLFDADSTLLADSRSLLSDNKKVDVAALPPTQPDEEDPRHGRFAQIIGVVFDIIDFIHERHEYPPYPNDESQNGKDYDIISHALKGEIMPQVWRLPEGKLLLGAAVPVIHHTHPLGAVMLTRSNDNIERAIYSVRIDILKIFCITLFITMLLSLYLTRAIARPIRLLALAADRLRHGQSQIVGLAGTADLLQPDVIPDMTGRRDEIGDLSGALRDLTSALSQRIGSIEHFAADVSHEIKNPLTSLRSAVETAERVQDPASQRKLMAVIRDDVDRLDRLITDISSASRLDAELSRAKTDPIDMAHMLGVIIDLYSQPAHEPAKHAAVVLNITGEKLPIMGVEVRLVQVLQNLIENALSFSPPQGKVILSATKQGEEVCIGVEDDGPGIPENKLNAIFERFYSERPRTEKFGMHSGLGLSIAKQIIEAHRGRIIAENRKDESGKIIGARFTIKIPALNN